MVEDDNVKTVPAFAGMTQTQKDEYFRQLYREQPNFKELARKDVEFAKIEKKGDLDFTDPKVVMQLTKTLLKLDFGLTLDLPPDRLCPTVKNRHNYIMWLKDLLDTTDDGSRNERVGMDIGTGASCIYPLLGCTERPWSFIGVDIDEESLTWAARNVESNKMQDRITLITSARDKHIIPFKEAGLERIDFTMTNPPFYTSEQEMLDSASKKNLPPATACTGAPVEMVTEGGEVGFVERILLQSLELRQKVQWYTAMFGFLSSVSKVVDLLQEHGIDNFAVTEFVQGVKTRRWAIAWSFHDLRPSQAICRGILTDAVQKSVLPAITEAIALRLSDVADADRFAQAFQTAISTLELESWEWDKKKMSGTGKARDKVWARAWRRKRKREAEGEDQAIPASTNTFGFKVWIARSENSLEIHSRWLQGHDAVTFESFRGFLKASAKSARTESNGPESK